MKQILKKIFRFFLKKNKKQTPKDHKTYANIGNNVRLMGENILDKVNPHLVFIGDNCVIGYRSSILTHCPIRGGLKAEIGNYVWLGYGVIILPGTKLGNYTIVGAGSVVTKSFPDNVIIAGNPAKIIRELTVEEKKILQFRLKNKLPMGKNTTA